MTAPRQQKSRQHFVPQFYLRRFAVPGKKRPDEKFFLFGLRTADCAVIREMPVETVAYGKFFHDLPGDVEQSVENGLMELERRISAIHGRIVDSRTLACLSPEDRRQFAAFIALQQRRTQRSRDEVELLLDFVIGRQYGADALPDEAREFVRRQGSELHRVEEAARDAVERSLARHADADPERVRQVRQIAADVIGKAFDEIGTSLRAGEIPEEMRARLRSAADDPALVKRHHIRSLGPVSSSIAEIAAAMTWVLAVNETNVPFCTSDDPVVMLSIAAFQRLAGLTNDLPALVGTASEIRGHVAWASADGTPNRNLVVLFPLSPSILLMLGGNQSARMSGEVMKITDERVVFGFNALQAIQAREFVFANHDNLLPLAQFARIGRDSGDLVDRARRITRRPKADG